MVMAQFLFDIKDFIRQMFFSIDSMLYEWVGYLYDFLIDLAKLKIFNFENNAQIVALTKNIYMLIGIFMLFKIIFTLITIMSNPEGAFNEKYGTAQYLIPRISVALILFLMIPNIFAWMYELQQIILDEGVIPRIFGVVMGDFAEGETVGIVDERCVLTFDQDYEFEYQCAGTVYGSGSEATCSKSPFTGVDGTYYSGDADGERFKGVIPSGAQLVVDLSVSPTSVYFVNDRTTDISQYNDIEIYRGNLLNGYQSIINVSGIVNNQSSGLSCDKYATFYFRPNIGDIYEYGITFYDSPPDSISGEVGLTKIGALEIISDRYELTTGRQFASYILSGFVSPTAKMEESRIQQYELAVNQANYAKMSEFLNGRALDKSYEIRYLYIISSIFAILILGILASTSFDIAKRVIALGFLQLIAPIPIAAYIQGGEEGPKDNSVYKNYIKKVSGVYLDIFLRVAALSFALFILKQLVNFDHIDFIQSNAHLLDRGVVNQWLLNLFLILGALMFIHELPAMLMRMFGLEGIASVSSMLELNPLKKLGSEMEKMPLVQGGIKKAAGLAQKVGTGVATMAGGALGGMMASAGGNLVDAVRAGRLDDLARGTVKGAWTAGPGTAIQNAKKQATERASKLMTDSAAAQGYNRGFDAVGAQFVKAQQENVAAQNLVKAEATSKLQDIVGQYHIDVKNDVNVAMSALTSQYNNIENRLNQVSGANVAPGVISSLQAQLSDLASRIDQVSDIKDVVDQAQRSIEDSQRVIKTYGEPAEEKKEDDKK